MDFSKERNVLMDQCAAGPMLRKKISDVGDGEKQLGLEVNKGLKLLENLTLAR